MLVTQTLSQDVTFLVCVHLSVYLGINDPNTAIDGILHLGKLLSEACKQDGNYVTYSENSIIRVISPQKKVEELLYVTFYQICHYGKFDISIILATYEALIAISEVNEKKIKNKVW